MSHLYTGTLQIRCTSTTKQQQTPYTYRLCISRKIRESVSNTGANGHRHRDRPSFSNIASQQSNHDGLLCQQHHCLHHGDRQDISNGSEWQRTISQGIGSSSGIKGTRHLNEAFTSLQLTKPRQHREIASNSLWTSTCHQRAHQNQLRVIKHSAFLINNYLIHSDGVSSYFKRWKSDNKTPVCEFGESILYMPSPAIKQYPRLENRFYPGIWPGKDTSSGASYVGIGGKVIKARTIRRQVKPWKYNRQLMDVINGAPWAPSPSHYNPHFILPSTTSAPKRTEEEGITTQEAKTPTIEGRQPMEEETSSSKKQKVTITEETPAHPTTSPTSFAPSMTPARAPAGSPTSRRTLDGSITEGSTSKQQMTTTEQQTKERPEASAEPPRTKGRINAITVQLKNGQQVTTATCEDPAEAKVEQRLMEPITKDPQGFDQEKLKQGIMKEMASMVNQRVFEEITLDQATEEEKRNIIGSKWVHRSHQRLRWRLCINTTLCNPQGHPVHFIGKVLEHQGRRHQHSISTCTSWSNNKHPTPITNRVLNQQEHLLETEEGDVWSQVITKSLARPSSKHHERTRLHTTHIRAQCVQASRRKSLHHGVRRRSTIRRRNRRDQQHLQQNTRKDVATSNWWGITRQHHLFLGEKDHKQRRSFWLDISLDDEYVVNIFHETRIKCNPATTTGTTAGKANIEGEQLLDQREHQQFRRLVGKLQLLAYTRPDISCATKELARALQEPTIKDQKKLRHLVRYLAGTKDYKCRIRPTIKLYNNTPQQLDLNIYVDSDLAGCHQTRRSTTGFVIELLGTCIHFGSRTQAVVALSSAEAEFYAIGTGAQEALYIRNFIMEALNTKRINVRIHTDSSAGKSMVTRQRVSKRAKHIEFKFIQNLIQGGVVHYTRYQPKATQQTSSQSMWKKCWDGSSSAQASTLTEAKLQQISPVSPVCM